VEVEAERYPRTGQAAEHGRYVKREAAAYVVAPMLAEHAECVPGELGGDAKR
jgi:hypothetical protein